MRKRWLWGGVAVVVVAVALAMVALRQRAHGEGADGRKAPATIEFASSEVARPLRTTLPERVEFTGPLMAPNTAIVRAKASGTLLSLKVAEGSRVVAGQLLGSIDLADLQSRANERSAGVDSARARLVEAERMFAANENLAKQQFISATALDSSRATLQAARALLRSAEAQLATSAVGIRDAALVAPITGVVGKKSVVPGEKVSPEQELLQVVDLRVLEMTGVVGTHQVSSLAPGQKVSVRIEGSSAPVEGRIDRIAPVAEPGTRGIRVVAVLANANERFRAGQYASAVVVLDDPVPRLTVPLSAVGQASGQDYVWTLERGVLVRRIVVTGRRDLGLGRVEVLQGLPADAQLVAVRFDTLKEGLPARVAPAGTARVAPAGSASAASAGRG